VAGVIEHGGLRPVPLVHDPAGVTGVGDVVADLNQELRETEYVGVDVEPDLGRAVTPLFPLAVGHAQAARRAVS
jgi:hypothetical protein